MDFVRSSDKTLATHALQVALNKVLNSHNRVLWLVPGGSNIPLSVEVMKAIDTKLTKNLKITLTDERYGPVGHPDSNYKQLNDSGFGANGAQFISVLVDGLTLEQTAEHYADSITKLIEESDYLIGQFGIGPDGHIAGILPGSPASTATTPTCGYDAGELKRLTLTFPTLRQIDEAYAFAYGDNKHQALANLKDRKLHLKQQPAQILRHIKSSYVYNDQVG